MQSRYLWIAGICGTDHAESLPWLIIDNELMAYVKRIARGFEINAETLATDVVHAVGPGGSFPSEAHTVRHFRQDIWLPGAAWERDIWESWDDRGRTSMADRSVAEVKHILNTHEPEPMDEALLCKVDRIIQAVRRELA